MGPSEAAPPPAELEWVEPILKQTNTLQVATGIVNIWSADGKSRGLLSPHREGLPRPVPARRRRRPSRTHPDTASLYDALVEYLDCLMRTSGPTSRRVIAALGHGVHKLSAQAQCGRASLPDHPGAHRAGPRNIGPTVYLAPEHKVVLTTDTERLARSAARPRLLFQPEQLPQQLETAGVH